MLVRHIGQEARHAMSRVRIYMDGNERRAPAGATDRLEDAEGHSSPREPYLRPLSDRQGRGHSSLNIFIVSHKTKLQRARCRRSADFADGREIARGRVFRLELERARGAVQFPIKNVCDLSQDTGREVDAPRDGLIVRRKIMRNDPRKVKKFRGVAPRGGRRKSLKNL